ncbi:MAG: DUF4332 domain-containing protein, partial [Anaerolineae bacterium]|nr:DUF4332 domain-containing protein [Anaerolineae bacterium]
MPAQEKLNRDDQLVAYIVGLGITIVIIAFILMALGTVDSKDALNFGVVPGLVLILIGIVVWLFQVQPWKKFDDLTTPAFTGHHDHDAEHDDKHSEVEVEVEAEAEVEVEEPAAAEPEPEPVVEPEPEPVVEPEAEPEPVVEAELVKAEVVEEESEPEPEPEPVAEAAAEVVEEAPAADDLTLIEGIGPKSADALAAAGITTFAQVGEMAPADLEKTIKDQDVRLVGSAETWPEQARVAAGGDMTALEDLQQRIKGVTEPAEDDLTLIEGIGPKSADALKAAGVKTFAQVAKTSPEELEKMIKDQKVRLVGSTETWPQQAELAAAGKLSELETFQNRIKGGILQDE